MANVIGHGRKARETYPQSKSAGSSQPKATISVTVPALANATLGYVNVSTVGTNLAGIVAGDVVVAEPTADLAAAGANGGFYVGCRVSAPNTVRLAFYGNLAGGAVNFSFAKL